MNLDLLRLLRNVFVRTAVISLLFSYALALVTFVFWNTWISITAQLFHTTAEALGPQLVTFFVIIKFYILFVLVAPAAALHWTVKTSEGKT